MPTCLHTPPNWQCSLVFCDACGFLLGRVERQGVCACADNRGHDHINGDIKPTHGDGTALWHHTAPTIRDELSRIRIKKLHIEVHERTVIQGHDEGETLLDEHAVAIHIERINEAPIHGDTIVHKQITQELCGERRGVRFSFANEETDSTLMVIIVMIVPTASAHNSREQEETN